MLRREPAEAVKGTAFNSSESAKAVAKAVASAGMSSRERLGVSAQSRTMTFPWAWPCSRYAKASAILSNGKTRSVTVFS
jgi:hypothetical protein